MRLKKAAGFIIIFVYEMMYFSFEQGAAKNPNAADQQQKLKQAAEDLRSATNAAASDALKKKLVKRLEVGASSKFCLKLIWTWILVLHVVGKNVINVCHC